MTLALDSHELIESAARPTSSDLFSISDLTAEFGVTTRTIRFYEDEGLLTPERRGQTRVFSRRDRARLAWILRGKSVGFSLAEIREMLDLYDLPDGGATQRAVAVARCQDRIAALEAQRANIDATIDELQRFVAQVEALPPAPAKRKG